MAEVLFRAKLERDNPSTPWGFRLQGGMEYNKPLTLLKVVEDSVAYKAGLHPGDLLVRLAGQSADDMTHKVAQESINASGDSLEIIVERAEEEIASPTGHTAQTPLVNANHKVPSSIPPEDEGGGGEGDSGGKMDIVSTEDKSDINSQSFEEGTHTIRLNCQEKCTDSSGCISDLNNANENNNTILGKQAPNGKLLPPALGELVSPLLADDCLSDEDDAYHTSSDSDSDSSIISVIKRDDHKVTPSPDSVTKIDGHQVTPTSDQFIKRDGQTVTPASTQYALDNAQDNLSTPAQDTTQLAFSVVHESGYIKAVLKPLNVVVRAKDKVVSPRVDTKVMDTLRSKIEPISITAQQDKDFIESQFQSSIVRKDTTVAQRTVSPTRHVEYKPLVVGSPSLPKRLPIQASSSTVPWRRKSDTNAMHAEHVRIRHRKISSDNTVIRENSFDKPLSSHLLSDLVNDKLSDQIVRSTNQTTKNTNNVLSIESDEKSNCSVSSVILKDVSDRLSNQSSDSIIIDATTNSINSSENNSTVESSALKPDYKKTAPWRVSNSNSAECSPTSSTECMQSPKTQSSQSPSAEISKCLSVEIPVSRSQSVTTTQSSPSSPSRTDTLQCSPTTSVTLPVITSNVPLIASSITVIPTQSTSVISLSAKSSNSASVDTSDNSREQSQDSSDKPKDKTNTSTSQPKEHVAKPNLDIITKGQSQTCPSKTVESNVSKNKSQNSPDKSPIKGNSPKGQKKIPSPKSTKDSQSEHKKKQNEEDDSSQGTCITLPGPVLESVILTPTKTLPKEKTSPKSSIELSKKDLKPVNTSPKNSMKPPSSDSVTVISTSSIISSTSSNNTPSTTTVVSIPKLSTTVASEPKLSTTIVSSTPVTVINTCKNNKTSPKQSFPNLTPVSVQIETSPLSNLTKTSVSPSVTPSTSPTVIQITISKDKEITVTKSKEKPRHENTSEYGGHPTFHSEPVRQFTKEERQAVNAEFHTPTQEDIYFSAQDPDLVGISMPAVKEMVSDLNRRLEAIAAQHPKIVQEQQQHDNKPEIGLVFTKRDQKEQPQILEILKPPLDIKDIRALQHEQETRQPTPKFPPPPPYTPPGHPGWYIDPSSPGLKEPGLIVPGALKQAYEGRISPRSGRRVTFANPVQTVVEIPNAKQNRLEQRRSFDEVYHFETTSDSVPMSTVEEDYPSESVKCLAEKLDRIERENEMSTKRFRDSLAAKKQQASALPRRTSIDTTDLPSFRKQYRDIQTLQNRSFSQMPTSAPREFQIPVQHIDSRIGTSYPPSVTSRAPPGDFSYTHDNKGFTYTLGPQNVSTPHISVSFTGGEDENIASGTDYQSPPPPPPPRGTSPRGSPQPRGIRISPVEGQTDFYLTRYPPNLYSESIRPSSPRMEDHHPYVTLRPHLQRLPHRQLRPQYVPTSTAGPMSPPQRYLRAQQPFPTAAASPYHNQPTAQNLDKPLFVNTAQPLQPGLFDHQEQSRDVRPKQNQQTVMYIPQSDGAVDQEGLTQSRSFQNLMSNLTSGVAHPAAAARPYIPNLNPQAQDDLPAMRAYSHSPTTPPIDMYSTPSAVPAFDKVPGIFAFLDKDFAEKFLHWQRQQGNAQQMPSETLKLVQEMDEEKRYAEHHQQHHPYYYQ